MSKLHHAETRELQATYSRLAKRPDTFNARGGYRRRNGKPLTGVDFTYLACFRGSHDKR